MPEGMHATEDLGPLQHPDSHGGGFDGTELDCKCPLRVLCTSLGPSVPPTLEFGVPALWTGCTSCHCLESLAFGETLLGFKRRFRIKHSEPSLRSLYDHQ